MTIRINGLLVPNVRTIFVNTILKSVWINRTDFYQYGASGIVIERID